MWFHVDNLSSAHVYLRLPSGATVEDIPPETLEDCAQLVKANSIQGSKQTSVDIVYTMWSNLRKTAAMEVGQVRRPPRPSSCACRPCEVHDAGYIGRGLDPLQKIEDIYILSPRADKCPHWRYKMHNMSLRSLFQSPRAHCYCAQVRLWRN